MSLRVVVQEIHVWWTKASRGNPGASTRNAVPRALALPADVVESADRWLFHGARALETDDFVLARTGNRFEDDGSEALDVGCARLAREREVLRVRFEYLEAYAGMPRRIQWDARSTSERLAIDVRDLSPGQWARVEWNGRFTHPHWDHAEWWYEQWTINVALTERLGADLFLRSEPTSVCSQLADLW